MTLANISIRIERIKTLLGDHEAAHSDEDKLYLDFIRYVAKTDKGRLGKMAKMLMTTQELPIERWTA